MHVFDDLNCWRFTITVYIVFGFYFSRRNNTVYRYRWPWPMRSRRWLSVVWITHTWEFSGHRLFLWYYHDQYIYINGGHVGFAARGICKHTPSPRTTLYPAILYSYCRGQIMYRFMYFFKIFILYKKKLTKTIITIIIKRCIVCTCRRRPHSIIFEFDRRRRNRRKRRAPILIIRFTSERIIITIIILDPVPFTHTRWYKKEIYTNVSMCVFI